MSAPKETEAPLVVAVPSKGRLQENAAAFFARAGLEFVTGRGAARANIAARSPDCRAPKSPSCRPPKSSANWLAAARIWA